MLLIVLKSHTERKSKNIAIIQRKDKVFTILSSQKVTEIVLFGTKKDFERGDLNLASISSQYSWMIRM